MKRSLMPLLLLACSLVGGASCAPAAPPPPARAGVKVTPESIAFTCVTPGCDTSRTLSFEVVGSRRVAVKRVVLDGDAAGDFKVTPSEAVPLILGAGATFTVDVRYAPLGAPAAGTAQVVLSYTDASADETDDRIAPGEVKVSLVRRLVGEPVLVAHPEKLVFGAVPAGQTKSLNLEIRNEGFGNVAAGISEIDGGSPDLAVAAPSTRSLLTDAGVVVPVAWTPRADGYLNTQLSIIATAADIAPVLVSIEGTSLTTPRAAFEPTGAVDFGEVPRKQTKKVLRRLVNQGGAPLVIESIALNDASGNLKVQFPLKMPVTLAPLERLELPVEVDAAMAGAIDASVEFFTNDPDQPVLLLPVGGTVTEPTLTATATQQDFGTVPIGWVVTTTVELRNTGYGPLTLKNVVMVAGSSTLFTVGHRPDTPSVLERNQRAVVEVQFRAESSATFAGSLSIESDDPDHPFIELPLHAAVGTCAQGCHIANGVPSCSTGKCEVSSCNPGWYDVDGNAASGCECHEPSADPGAFCESAKDVGTLKDNAKGQGSVTGLVPSAGDVDLIRFFAEDDFSLFSDSFDVKIRLESNDPTIRLCVYRYPTGSHQSECYLANEVCPDNRTFHQSGKGASNDGSDYVVKVYREEGAAPSCTPYTVFMSNGL